MDPNFASPTTLGVVAILISTAGTALGVYLNYKKEQRTAHKEDLQSAYDRLDVLEEKLAARDKVIDQQAELIRELRDQLAVRDRTIADQEDQIRKLKARVSRVEEQQNAG